MKHSKQYRHMRRSIKGRKFLAGHRVKKSRALRWPGFLNINGDLVPKHNPYAKRVFDMNLDAEIDKQEKEAMERTKEFYDNYKEETEEERARRKAFKERYGYED